MAALFLIVKEGTYVDPGVKAFYVVKCTRHSLPRRNFFDSDFLQQNHATKRPTVRQCDQIPRLYVQHLVFK